MEIPPKVDIALRAFEACKYPCVLRNVNEFEERHEKYIHLMSKEEYEIYTQVLAGKHLRPRHSKRLLLENKTKTR